jgi:uncharacterized membrane protein YidH (DUF202 family)
LEKITLASINATTRKNDYQKNPNKFLGLLLLLLLLYNATSRNIHVSKKKLKTFIIWVCFLNAKMGLKIKERKKERKRPENIKKN